MDNEFISDHRLLDLKNKNEQLVYLIGVSKYNSQTKQKEDFKYFYSDMLTKTGENDIIKQFGQYLNDVTDNGSKPFVLLHWFFPEIKQMKNGLMRTTLNQYVHILMQIKTWSMFRIC